MSSLGSAGEPARYEPGDGSADAGSSPLAARRAAEQIVADARAEAARLLSESAAAAQRVADEARSAAVQVELEIARQWEQIAAEREKLDRASAEWQSGAGARALERDTSLGEPAVGGLGDVDEARLAELAREEERLRRRVSEERDRLFALFESALAQLDSLDLTGASLADPSGSDSPTDARHHDLAPDDPEDALRSAPEQSPP